jgi:PKD repeat protein
MNVIIKQFLIFLFAGALFYGCTKKEDVPAPLVQEPQFLFAGKLGADSVKLFAGINEYYMFTTFEKDSGGRFILSGELKKQNCNPCSEVLKVSVYDDSARSAAEIANIEEVLASATYNFQSKSGGNVFIPSNKIQFTAEVSGQSFFWDFGDGVTSTLANPLHTFPTGNPYKVCLTVNDTTKNTTVCDTIIVNDLQNCNVQFDMQPSASLTKTFTATAGKANYRWTFNDGTNQLNTTNATITHTFSSPGIYKVYLTAAGASCSSSFLKKLPINTPDTSVAAYRYNITPGTTITTAGGPPKVIIEWTKKNGVVYTSYKKNYTSSTSLFTIKEGGMYKPNLKGQKTFKFSAGFNAFLFNKTNPLDSLLINSEKLKIAVAFP